MTERDLLPPTLTLDMVRRALAKGERARAEVIASRLFTQNSDDAETAALLAEAILARDGYVSHAADVLAPFQDEARGHAGLTVRLAEVRLRSGDADAARSYAKGLDDPRARRIARAADILAEPAPSMEHVDDGELLLLLGQALNGQGRFGEATPAVLRALQLTDRPWTLYPTLMRALAGVGQLDDVLKVCRWARRDALRLSPSLRGELIAESGNMCRALAEARPDHGTTMAIQATALLEETRTFNDGVALLNRARGLDPTGADVCLGAGYMCFRLGDFTGAAEHLATSDDGDPDHQEMARLQGLVELANAGTIAAANIADDVMATELLILGEALSVGQRLEDAVVVLNRALELSPGQAETATRLIIVLAMVGAPARDCLAIGAEALANAPENAELLGEIAGAALAAGDLDAGWAFNEARFEHWRRDTGSLDAAATPWEGESLTGKRVLIQREEGIGDEVRFASCLPDLIARYADAAAMTFVCTDRLHSLFQRSFPDLDVRTEPADGVIEGAFDVHVPLMSIPRYLRRRIDDFPQQGDFLIADADRRRQWRERLDDLSDGPKIGIGWKTGSASWRKRVLVTALADWDPLLASDGVTLVNLQHKDATAEIAAAAQRTGKRLHCFDRLDLTNDLENVTALIAELDMVVGARCWIPTFAGHVGTPAHVVARRPHPYTFDLDYDVWAPAIRYHYAGHDEDWSGQITAIVELIRETFGLG